MNDPLMVALSLVFLSVLCSLLLVFLAVNIWQRQRTEEALHTAYALLDERVKQRTTACRASEVRFRLMAEAASDFLYEWGIHSDNVLWFGEIDQALGFAPEEFPHTLTAWQARIHPEDRGHFHHWSVHQRDGGDTLHIEYRIRSKDGAWRYWLDRSTAVFDANGQLGQLVGSCLDVTQMRETEQALRHSEEKYRHLIESLSHEYFFYRHDADGVFTYISPSIKQVLGYSQAEFLFHYSKYLTDDPINLAADKYTEYTLQGQKPPPYELDLCHKKGGRRRIRVTEFPVFTDDGQVEAVQGIAQDITVQYQVRLLQKGRGRVLEMIAQDEPLSDILCAILEFIESVNQEMLCSVMLYDAEHQTLSVGAAPSLPDFYCEAVDGVKIADEVGSCGTAIFRGERVINEDILNHPYWRDFRELVEKTPLRSCWSEPIYSRAGQILGTFAIYYRTSRLPSEDEQYLVQAALNLTSIAIDQHQGLQALQDSEKRLSMLIEAIPDAVYLKDGQGRWQIVNAAGLQWFDLQHQPWQGKTELELADMQPEYGAKHQACFLSDEVVWDNQCASTSAEHIEDEQGQMHYFEVNRMPLFDALGERKGLVVLGRDVTQQKHLEASLKENQRYLQSALNATRAGKFLYDAVLNSNVWDARSLEIFGLQPDEFGGTHEAWQKCVHPEDLLLVEPKIQQAFNEKTSFDIEYRVVQPSGAIRHVRAQAWILRDEHQRVSKVSGLHFDVTRRKQAESELEQAKEDAEAANRAKTAFLANMGHELRTPLNSILGYAHILQQEPQLDEVLSEQLSLIQHNAQHLLMLINDVLDLSKIEAGKIELHPSEFALQTFFQELAHFFSQQALQKCIEFAYESKSCETRHSFPAVVRGDEKRLRQILFNLLSNALKFTEQGCVKLSVAYCEHTLSVSVEDTGEGIAEQELEKIFLPFHQVKGQKYHKGTGLGLAITHKLLKLMDAQLTVKSQIGRGSHFSFEMPLDILSWDTESLHQYCLDGFQAPPSSALSVMTETNEALVDSVAPQVLEELRSMAALGDVSAILDYLEVLPTEGITPSESTFYTQAMRLARGFKISELQLFLQ